MSGKIENRRHPRLEIVLKVEYDSPQDFLADYTANVSGGGLFIATTRPFQVGEKLSFDISFPGLLDPIHCYGEVRWIRGTEKASDNEPAGIGVAFIYESAEQEQKIRQLIEQLSQPDAAPSGESTDKQEIVFRVMLAEDNPLVLEMIRFGLRRYHRSQATGCQQLQVIEASNGQEAWELIQGTTIDLAIVDFYMPVMDGGHLVRKLREQPAYRNLPVIVVSVGGDEARREAYQAGADLYLDKPILFDKLFASLRQLLNRNSSWPAPDHEGNR